MRKPLLTLFITSVLFTQYPAIPAWADLDADWHQLTKEGRHKAAVEMTTRAISSNPKNAQSYYLRSKSYDSLGRMDLALQDINDAGKLDPANQEYVNTKAYFLQRTGKWRDAADVYSHLSDAKSQAKKALCLCKLHQFGEAEKLLNAALKSNPKDREIRTLAHQIYTDTDQEQKALTNLDEWVKFDPECATLYWMREQLLFNLGRNQEALVAGDKLIALEPQPTGEQFLMRAYVKTNLRNLPGAIADFTSAIAKQPKQSIFYMKRGDCYRNAGDLKAAAADYTTALNVTEASKIGKSMDARMKASMKQHAATIILKRAITYEKDHLFDKAIADFTTLLDENAQVNQALESRVRLLMQTKKYDQAVIDYTRLIELDDDFPRWREGRAKAYRMLHQDDLAAKDEAEARRLSLSK